MDDEDHTVMIDIVTRMTDDQIDMIAIGITSMVSETGFARDLSREDSSRHIKMRGSGSSSPVAACIYE